MSTILPAPRRFDPVPADLDDFLPGLTWFDPTPPGSTRFDPFRPGLDRFDPISILKVLGTGPGPSPCSYKIFPTPGKP